MSTPQAATPADVALTREEQAFFIRSFWEASLTPNWTNDPLIELGKVVGARIPLPRLMPHQLDVLWPFLLQVAQKLGALVLEQAGRSKDAPLSKEDTAFFMRSYYDAISAPAWKRPDIIAFGTAIRDKIPLGKLDEVQMKTFWPYLLVISQKLGSLVIKQAEASRPVPAQPTAPAVPQPTPPAAPKPAATPQPTPPVPAQPTPPTTLKPAATPQPPTSTIAQSPPEPVPTSTSSEVK